MQHLGLLGLLAGLGIAGFAVAMRRYDLAALGFVGALLSGFTFPARIIVAPVSGLHIGIADASPSLNTTTAMIFAFFGLVALLAIGLPGLRLRLPPVAFVFIVSMGVAITFVWDGSAEQRSGVIALTAAWGAWLIGASLAPTLIRNVATRRNLVRMLFFCVAVQAGVAVLQTAGIQLFPMDPKTAAIMGARTNGTYVHPAVLGKWLLFVQVLLLYFVSDTDRAVRRVAWLGIALAFLPLGLSQGRANLIASVVLCVVWLLFLSGRSVTLVRRVGMLGVLVLLAAPFVQTLATRFADDPSGGPRPELAAAAYEQIGLRPFTGAGPNAYITAAAPYDTWAATGWPVHNAFLMSTAELGIPLAIVFWTPIFLLFVTAWRRRQDPLAGKAARPLLAAAPGLYLITATGFGILTPPNILQFFFVLGFFSAVLQSTSPRPTTSGSQANVRRNVGRDRIARDVGSRGAPVRHDQQPN